MTVIATLNIRLPEDLKQHGNQVLEKSGVSTSEVIRRLYEYMSREQKLPECLVKESAEDIKKRKRAALRKLSGIAKIPDTDKAIQEYKDHLVEKHAPGVRI